MRSVADRVSAKPLHSHRASAQDTSVYVLTDSAAGRAVRFRFRADTLPQDGLSGPSPCHAAYTVIIDESDVNSVLNSDAV